MNIIADTSSNLIDPNDTTELTPENIASREFGSKMVLVVEQMQCLTIWLVKACLLIMYGRLTYVNPNSPRHSYPTEYTDSYILQQDESQTTDCC